MFIGIKTITSFSWIPFREMTTLTTEFMYWWHFLVDWWMSLSNVRWHITSSLCYWHRWLSPSAKLSYSKASNWLFRLMFGQHLLPILILYAFWRKLMHPIAMHCITWPWSVFELRRITFDLVYHVFVHLSPFNSSEVFNIYSPAACIRIT